MNKRYQYMDRYKEKNYAPKERKLEKNSLKQYQDRDSCRQTAEASCSNSIECCPEIQEEITQSKAGLHEEERSKPDIEAHSEGRQGIPKPNKRRRKAKERDPETINSKEEV